MKRRTHWIEAGAASTSCGLPLKRGARASEKPTCAACTRIRRTAQSLKSAELHLKSAERRLRLYEEPGAVLVALNMQEAPSWKIQHQFEAQFQLRASVFPGPKVWCVDLSIDRLASERGRDPAWEMRSTAMHGWHQIIEKVVEHHVGFPRLPL